MRAERVTSAVETTGRAAEGVLLDHLDAVSLERAAVTAAAACARPTLRDSVDPARDDDKAWAAAPLGVRDAGARDRRVPRHVEQAQARRVGERLERGTEACVVEGRLDTGDGERAERREPRAQLDQAAWDVVV